MKNNVKAMQIANIKILSERTSGVRPRLSVNDTLKAKEKAGKSGGWVP